MLENIFMRAAFSFFVYSSILFHIVFHLYEFIRLVLISKSEIISVEFLECNELFGAMLVIEIFKYLIFIVVAKVIFLTTNPREYENLSENSELLSELSSFMNNNSSFDYENYIVEYKAIISLILYIFATYSSTIGRNLFIIPLNIYVIAHILYETGDRIYITLTFYILYIVYTVYTGLIDFFINKFRRLDINLIPESIINFFTDKGLQIKAYDLKKGRFHLDVFGLGNFIYLFIFGDAAEILTEDEFTSILFHEIGHFYFNSLGHDFLVISFKLAAFCISGYILIKNDMELIEHENILDDPAYVKNVLMIYIALEISLFPLISVATNFIYYYEEIDADRFSTLNFDKKYLISGVKKLSLHNDLCYNSSWLFNVMYLEIPTLNRRLKLIKSF